jgi:hypothetical protein
VEGDERLLETRMASRRRTSAGSGESATGAIASRNFAIPFSTMSRSRASLPLMWE